jgi:hypothetical protein
VCDGRPIGMSIPTARTSPARTARSADPGGRRSRRSRSSRDRRRHYDPSVSVAVHARHSPVPHPLVLAHRRARGIRMSRLEGKVAYGHGRCIRHRFRLRTTFSPPRVPSSSVRTSTPPTPGLRRAIGKGRRVPLAGRARRRRAKADRRRRCRPLRHRRHPRHRRRGSRVAGRSISSRSPSGSACRTSTSRAPSFRPKPCCPT